MLENITMSLQSIWGHKLRSLLTMLGVIIGIAAIIAIFSLIEGNTASLKKQLIGGENNTMAVEYGEKKGFELTDDGGSATTKKAEKEAPTYVPTISEQQLATIRQLSKVKEAALIHQFDLRIFNQDLGEKSSIKATTPEYFKMVDFRLLKGRYLTEADMSSGGQLVVLDRLAAERLFPKADPLGKRVEINGHPFKVIGVVEEIRSEAENQYGLPPGAQAFIASNNWFLLGSGVDAQPKVLLQSEKTDDLGPATKKVSQLLSAELPPSTHTYGVYSANDFAKNLAEMDQANFYLLGGIASISLLVGGIGVMNIMLVSVTERTREIGVKMALGARKKTILSQFLIEAVVLTVIGGILGVISGLLVAKGITVQLHFPFIISLKAISGSLLFSLGIGVVFGLMPALKAAKLSPIEALRYE